MLMLHMITSDLITKSVRRIPVNGCASLAALPAFLGTSKTTQMRTACPLGILHYTSLFFMHNFPFIEFRWIASK